MYNCPFVRGNRGGMTMTISYNQPYLSSPGPDSVLWWQMADERGSWEERGNENRWGLKLKKREKGTRVNWSKGGGNLHPGTDRWMDYFFPFTFCPTESMPVFGQMSTNCTVKKYLQDNAWRKTGAHSDLIIFGEHFVFVL